MVAVRLCRSIALIGALFSTDAFVQAQSVRAASPGGSSAGGRRVIKQFDFDEAHRGNFEALPMFWERHRDRGFPEYVQGSFDVETGHGAPPSFFLQSKGRNCAYHYTGLDITSEPGNDYLISARVKPQRLKNARAFISAFMRDANGLQIDGTERRSRLVGGPDDTPTWREVSVRMSGDVDGAYSIGISVWVVQRSHWQDADPAINDIDHKDVYGSAWFDDIAVYRLPNIELSSTAAGRGNVYSSQEVPVLLVKVGDVVERGLRSGLRVRDGAGATVYEQQIEAGDRAGAAGRRIQLSGLLPGIYHVRLNVEIEQGASIERHLTFALLAPELKRPRKFNSRYGVVVHSDGGWSRQAEVALLDALGVRSVKLSLANVLNADASQEQQPLSTLVDELSERHLAITGTLVSSSFTRQDGTGSQSQTLIDVLSASVETWRPQVANLVSKYQNRFANWQVGPDGESEVFDDVRLEPVLTHLRDEMAKLTTLPTLVAPSSIQYERGESNLPANILSITVPAVTPPSEIPGHLDESIPEAGYQQIWAFIQLPPPEPYRRLPWLIDVAKRFIFAQQSSVDKVFVRQPWNRRYGTGGTMIEPIEPFLILRTVISLLDDAAYMGQLETSEGVTCHAFDRGGRAVLVMWDDGAPMAGRSHDLYLNGATHMVDLWGRQTTLSERSGTVAVTLSPVPVFIHAAETWLVRFRRSLKFDPLLLPSESTFHEHQVLIHNSRKDPISGSIRLKPPKGWQIRPSHFTFAAQGNETFAQKVRIQSAPRAPAGRQQIETKVMIDAAKLYEFTVYLPLQLDLSDMDVSADLVVEGEDVVIRHRITNRSDEVVTFTSFADAPGRKRQTMNILGLQPDQTVVKAHRFPDGRALSGKVIRVGLKQVKGPRSHNLTVAVP